MRHGLTGIMGGCLLLLFTVGLAGAQQQQGKQQQKCINRVNKGAVQVLATQAKVTASCIADYALRGGNAEACLLDDPRGKVERAQGKLDDDAARSCVPGQYPNIAYTGGLFAGTSAAQAEIDLAHALYGNPIDAGLFLCADNINACKCQRQVSRRVAKVGTAMGKAFLKCKQARLAGTKGFVLPATSAAQIAECVTGASPLSVDSDGRGRIDKALGSVRAAAHAYCWQSVDDEFHGGLCAGHYGDPGALSDCIEGQARCHFCRMVRAVDDLDMLDCTAWSGVACAP